jgi:hypothetical protein
MRENVRPSGIEVLRCVARLNLFFLFPLQKGGAAMQMRGAGNGRLGKSAIGWR